MMERLTTNKDASEMGMYELAHNCCYVGEDGAARYRDFETDSDSRELIRRLYDRFADEYISENDDLLDDELIENLQYGFGNISGLLAVFYRNLWAMADLRSGLIHWEDLKEQELILKLPCKIGEELYDITEFIEGYDSPDIYKLDTSRIEISRDESGLIYCIDSVDFREKDFGTVLFKSEEDALNAIRELGVVI